MNEPECASKDDKDNFRSFFECVNDIIIVGTSDGTILYSNTAATKMLGYSPDEFRGMNMLDLHPADIRQDVSEIESAMQKGAQNVCPRHLVKKDGVLVPAEIRVWPGRWNDMACIFGIFRDLTVEQEAQQRFETVFRNNPALMAISTMPDRRFFDINDESPLRRCTFLENDQLIPCRNACSGCKLPFLEGTQ